jgi:cobalt-zinc-cadmium efflux system membrane fusion protein
MSRHLLHAFGALLLAGMLLPGCTKTPTPEGPAATDASAKADAHTGWWCNEHGVPEEVCTRCHAELIAEFKAKSDWCKEHDLPDSQCFVCHPEREAAFAAQYEARYGEKPPKPTDADEGAEPGVTAADPASS